MIYHRLHHNLHSTMLLLYRARPASVHYNAVQFTFHYASTLSDDAIDALTEFVVNLHSTMLLLYPSASELIRKADIHLHSTMLLLYPVVIEGGAIAGNAIYIPLCFYFIEPHQYFFNRSSVIYIPLCFYFIIFVPSSASFTFPFTFHYASTLSIQFRVILNGSKEFTFHYASTLSK